MSLRPDHKIKSFNTFRSLDARNRHTSEANRWREPGDITNVPAMSEAFTTYSSYMYDILLEKGNYLRCSYMTLGYNLKPEWLHKIGFSTARLSFTAKNLFTISSYSGIDPALMGSFGLSEFPEIYDYFKCWILKLKEMKKLFLYVTLILSFTSCEKYLEVKPSNILALKTYDDVKSLLGSHLKLYTVTFFSSHELAGTNVPWRTDDLYLFFGFYSDDLNTDTWLNGNWMANNKRALYTNSLNWQNTTMPGTIWGNYFSNIGFYNTIIDELANVSASQEEKDIVEQEARFLRAWYLFKVLQYFSPYHSNELGIPFNTDSQAVGSYNKQRKTQAQVYRFLIDE